MSFSRVSAALVAATIAVTIAVSFLLVERHSRDGSFFLSLGFFLLAEVFLFAGPHLVRTGIGTRMAPWHIAMAGIPIGYALGVAGITIAAAAGARWRVLVSAQLIWLLLFVIALVIVRSTGTRISAGITADRANRASFASAVSQLEGIRQRCELMQGSARDSLLAQILRLREQMRYSAHDTLPEVSSFDATLTACLDALDGALQDIAHHPDGQPPVAECARQIQIARQALERREDAIASARA